MKELKSILAMLMCALGLSLGMSSCDNNDDDPLAIKSINVEYSLNLNQTWFDFFDIDVTYSDQAGQSHTVRVTKEWNYGFSVSPKIAPKNYVFTVLASPKAEHPAIQDGQYTLATDIKGDFFSYRYNGEIFKELSSDLHPYTLTNTQVQTFSASQFKDYFEDGRKTLMNFAKNWDGKY